MKSVFGRTGDKETSLTIIPSKVFGFIYYQCYRAKRPTNSSCGKFDRAEHDAVLTKSNETEAKIDLLQSNSIQHYLGAICGLLDDQILIRITEIRKEDIMTKSLKDLITLVKKRGREY